MEHARSEEVKPMGFKRHAKVFKLRFDDPELNGLEVKARSTSIGTMRKIQGSSDDAAERLLAAFTKALISWNLEDEDGNPVPASADGIDEYPDVDFIWYVIGTWVTAVTGVDEELGKDSPSGKRFQEGSLPMEPLSLNQAS